MMWAAAAATTVAAAVATLWLTPVGPRARVRWSAGPLGLRHGGGRRRKHAVLDCGAFESVDEWVASLKRSSRRSMAQAATLDPSLRLRVVRPWEMGAEHVAVAVDHELRAMRWRLVAPVAALFRVLVAFCMVGEVEEYRTAGDGRLVAWSQTVCKGNTARGMWFYQRSDWAKKMIWFHSVHQIVRRVIASRKGPTPLRWVDVGPSGTPAVEDVKRKLGFTVTDAWADDGMCDYTGEFVDCCEAENAVQAPQ